MFIGKQIDEFIKDFVTKRGESLLFKDFEKYSKELSNQINGKSVLVIGGAGSIGSHYIKAILKFRITKLIVVDINENGLTELVRDLRSSDGFNIPEDFITYPINFGDQVFEQLFKTHGPFQIVANFAAHKHVRSEKDVFSIQAMIENNVLRAKKLLDLLLENPPEHFFCVSTDKAANPVSIMGASKKLMEELIMTYSDRIPITTARFANVAFSNGSLPLGFLERLNKNQPWSCPADVKRFFVSPIESGELCLMASIMGESGDIIFPKLDPETDMIPFSDIARDLLHWLGMEVEECSSEEEAKKLSVIRAQSSEASSPESQVPSPKSWPVYFFESDTSGEKPYEEFFTEGEDLDMNKFAELGVIKNSAKRNKADIERIISEIRDLFDSESVSKEQVVEVLKDYLPNFHHLETGQGLDMKM